LLLVLAGAAIAHAAAEETDRPITKVIRVLKDMADTINKEHKEDEKVFKKLSCWCQSNDRERTKQIAKEKQEIEVLQAAVENGSGATGGAATKIKNLKDDIVKMQNSMKQATSVRKKEKAEYVAQDKDMAQSIQALKSATTVLKKHQGGSLVEVRRTISYLATMHSDIMDKHFKAHQTHQLNSFLQQKHHPQPLLVP